MDESDFEGSLILEKLAERNLVDAFFEAIDSDDFQKVARLLKQAEVSAEEISIVLKMISDELT